MAPNDDVGRDDCHISADITAMEDFARKLLAEVDNDYAPHADNLANQMLTRLPAVDGQFNELSAFAGVLQWAQDSCQQNIYNFANGTHGFAKAAEEVGGLYRGADAFARARLADVESALVTAGLLPPAPSAPAAPPPGAPSAASAAPHGPGASPTADTPSASEASPSADWPPAWEPAPTPGSSSAQEPAPTPGSSSAREPAPTPGSSSASGAPPAETAGPGSPAAPLPAAPALPAPPPPSSSPWSTPPPSRGNA
ncbi:hypothetical protein Asi03nite_39330 [Actinoplanes siamensis]|uniref:Uncharacterized protein n=1 Tax=Actinoplanes siamensis TaxID=1223317 RepID=A0A919N8T8_9ACTN|nr:hypothetical protein Asi03nite_39330 [Actinoplanes siamensis]